MSDKSCIICGLQCETGSLRWYPYIEIYGKCVCLRCKKIIEIEQNLKRNSYYEFDISYNKISEKDKP